MSRPITRLACVTAILLSLTAAMIDATQAPPTIVVTGDVAKPLTLGVADLKKMPRTTVTVERDGGKVVYEGVRVGELLARAGVPLGRDLMGPALATYVLATAVDSYEVLFSVGELDPSMTPYEVIVADTADGKPLGDTQGQFRIVIPLDKRGARSVRMLDRLEVVRLRK